MAVVEPGTELAEPLSERQLDALRKLEALGAAPRTDPTERYDSDPQIRAYQMVYEGRLGGPGRGQGRKRQPRAAEIVADEIRKRAQKIVNAIDNALESDNDKVALDAARTALKIEHDEATLKLQEEKQEADLAKMSKEDLVAELIALAGDPAVEGFIDLPESAVAEITEAEVITLDRGAKAPSGSGAPAHAPKARPHSRSNRGNGRGAASRSGGKTPNPFTKAAKRRAAD